MPLTRCRCSMNSCPKISFWCARWKLSAVALAAAPLPAPLPRPGPPCGAPVMPRSSSSSSVVARSSQTAPNWRITRRYIFRRSVRPRRAPNPAPAVPLARPLGPGPPCHGVSSLSRLDTVGYRLLRLSVNAVSKKLSATLSGHTQTHGHAHIHHPCPNEQRRASPRPRIRHPPTWVPCVVAQRI